MRMIAGKLPLVCMLMLPCLSCAGEKRGANAQGDSVFINRIHHTPLEMLMLRASLFL